MAYNPYNDLKQIYNYKSAYNKALNANDTAGMQNASNSAKSYYQNLRDNGYSNYADMMSGYTEEQALEMVNSLDPSIPSVQISLGGGSTEQPGQQIIPSFTQPVAQPTQTVTQPSANTDGSIYQNITQDIIDAVQGITDNKTLYDNSKYTLQDGNYQQYAELAIPYYDSLRAAGRSDIADYLSGSTTPAALEYLRSIGIELDPVQQDLNGIVNNLLTQPSQSIDMSAMWQQSQPIIDYINGITQPDAATQAANGQALNNMNALFGAVMGNNQQIQQDSGKLNDLISQYMGEQTARYDDLYDWLKNTNYYDTDTAKNIMSYYNAQGGKAANEATAEGMAQNSGNIDSYAAANALRQQLDFTNAGNQAVLNQYNAQAGNMLDTLKALGVDVGDAQDRMLGLLGGNQAYNAELAGQYNAGAADILGLINQNAQAGNTAAIDALNSLLGLYEAGMNNDTNRYLGQLDTAGDILANRDTQQAVVDSANATAEAEKAKAYSEYQAEIQRILSDENISEQEIQQKLTQAYLEYEAKIYAADADANAKITTSYNTLEGTKYSADKNAESDKYVANANASADKYVADTSAEATKYAADAKSKADGTGNAVLGVGDYTYDALLYTFGQLRPAIAESNTGATSDDVDEMTWNAIGKELGFTDAQIKQLVQYYRNAKYDEDGELISYGPQEQPPTPITDDTFVSP